MGFTKKVQKLEQQYAAGKISRADFHKKEVKAIKKLEKNCAHKNTETEADGSTSCNDCGGNFP